MVRERQEFDARLPRPEVNSGGPERLGGEDEGTSAAFGEDMGANPHSEAVGPRMEHAGHSGCGGHLSPRSSSSRLAIPAPWIGSSADRRSAAQAREEIGRQEGSRHRGDGLFAAAFGAISVDDRPDRERDGEARNRGEGRERDHSPDAFAPRAEAVAGKKCGASRTWTASTSNGWRMS